MSEGAKGALAQIQEAVVSCRRCPRLVEWRERVAREKRASFAQESYWGRPVPAFGDPAARVVIVGLAPAAHGANRTGRMFTGDRSGDWLFGALHRAGFANQAESTAGDDGLALSGALVTAAVRCAPPDNKPSPAERDACRPYLERELALLLPGAAVVVALGGFAYTQVLRLVKAAGMLVPTPRSRFAHGLELDLGKGVTLLASYHPSQQNTFTGRLTREMFDAIWQRAADLSRTGSAAS